MLLYFVYCLSIVRVSPLEVFLFVLLLLQKPLISEIIAIVDAGTYILTEGDLPHTYGIMQCLFTLQPGMFLCA